MEATDPLQQLLERLEDLRARSFAGLDPPDVCATNLGILWRALIRPEMAWRHELRIASLGGAHRVNTVSHRLHAAVIAAAREGRSDPPPAWLLRHIGLAPSDED